MKECDYLEVRSQKFSERYTPARYIEQTFEFVASARAFGEFVRLPIMNGAPLTGT
jgi:hypothetical protein